MKRNGNTKRELVRKIERIVGFGPTEKFGKIGSVKELRGYALFAQILDEAGYETPAHWDNWEWNETDHTMSVKVFWWQSEQAYDKEKDEFYRSLNERSAWVHFEDATMSGNSVRGFFKRFKNAPHFIDWSEVSALKERALPEDPVDEEEEDE